MSTSQLVEKIRDALDLPTPAERPVDTNPSPPYPSATHKVCADCPAYCCKSRFGWTQVALYPWDMANERLVKAMREKDVLIENDYGRESMKFVDGGCVFLGEDNSCGIYEDRPVSCRNVLCFTEENAFRNPKGPVKKRWDEWYGHLEAHGLQPDAGGAMHPKAWEESEKAYDAFYNLTVERVDRGDDTPLCRVSYQLAGTAHTRLFDPDMAQIEAGMPRELSVIIGRRVTPLFTQNELQRREPKDATVGDVGALPVGLDEMLEGL